MSARRVLLTGASGFLGSHLAVALLAAGYEVLALHRTGSDLRRLAPVRARLDLLNTDAADWPAQLRAWQATDLVHAAWVGGVSAAHRDDWPAQLANLDFLLRLLDVLSQGPLRQVVALGSQAEYGAFEGRVDEHYSPRPTTAYGAAKLAALELLRTYCDTRGLRWQWLRIFTAFGPGEDAHWFVSHVITRLLAANEPLDMTAGAQRYDYSFAPDLAAAVVQALAADPAPSGVFNLAAGQATSLRTVVETIQELTSSPTEVRFGAVPYRAGQVMHMEGDPTRFEQAFGPVRRTDLRPALAETIAYWRAIRATEPNA